MSDHRETHARPWAGPLAGIYPRDAADAVSAGIDALLARYRDIAYQSRDKVLSHEDVMLITYGDTLTGSEPPLQVLQVVRQAEDRHHFRSDRDVEAGHFIPGSERSPSNLFPVLN